MSRRFIVVAHLPKPESTAFTGDLAYSPSEWTIVTGIAAATAKEQQWQQHFNHTAIHEIKEPA